MGVTLSRLRSIFVESLPNQIRDWGGGDGFISRADEDREVMPWQTWLSPAVPAAAKALRATKSSPARVGRRELSAHMLEQAESLWNAVNQAEGVGRHYLSRAELSELAERNPSLGELVARAWDEARLQQKNEASGRSYAADVRRMLRAPVGDREQFEDLSDAWQERLLDWQAEAHPDLTVTASAPISALSDPAHRAFAQSMRDKMESEGSMEVQDDNYAFVGPIDVTVEIITAADGSIVGGRINFHQAGAMTDDLDSGYFDTADEARAAGFDPDADVQWSASGVFAHDLRAFRQDDYMEWSGH